MSLLLLCTIVENEEYSRFIPYDEGIIHMSAILNYINNQKLSTIIPVN
jgi:hypothetical protein